MDDLVWCRSCGRSASLAQAVTGCACSGCGGNDYFMALSSSEEDAYLSLSERMQRTGDWAVAEAVFRRCLSSGFMTAADFNLSLSQLSERKDCAAAACDCIRSASSALTVSALRSLLLRDFDDYTVSWVLSDFAGLTLVPFGSTYVVEVS